MHCHDCHAEGRTTEAVGLCHHCSVGLCPAHGALIADPILVHEPIIKTIALPKQARAFLCRTCLEALRQRDPLLQQQPAPPPAPDAASNTDPTLAR